MTQLSQRIQDHYYNYSPSLTALRNDNLRLASVGLHWW